MSLNLYVKIILYIVLVYYHLTKSLHRIKNLFCSLANKYLSKMGLDIYIKWNLWQFLYITSRKRFSSQFWESFKIFLKKWWKIGFYYRPIINANEFRSQSSKLVISEIHSSTNLKKNYFLKYKIKIKLFVL